MHLAEIPIIHRDVAARNCLLDNDLNIKLSDFGMAKVMQHVRGQTNPQYNFANVNECIAIPWAAPECLQQNICTPKSDVWSLGVTMWEFMSRCKERPYRHLQNCDQGEVLDFLKNDGRLEKPEGWSDKMFKFAVKKCWEWDNTTRPSAEEIKKKLLKIVDNPVRYDLYGMQRKTDRKAEFGLKFMSLMSVLMFAV